MPPKRRTTNSSKAAETPSASATKQSTSARRQSTAPPKSRFPSIVNVGLATFVVALAVAAYFFVLDEKTTTRTTRSAIPRLLSKRQLTNYTCDPQICQPPACMCPSRSPPGNLPLSSTPQFVIITFDDSVTDQTFEFTNGAIKDLYNPNGCPAKSTYYVDTMHTNFHKVHHLYAMGHDIADHTMTHAGRPSEAEIQGQRLTLQAYAGVPIANNKGFRSPFLSFDVSTLTTLGSLGFQWDSSISASPIDSFWPFTFDNGIPIRCDTGDCGDYSTRIPGLWEVPLYFYASPETNRSFATMDPELNNESLLALLKHNFLLHYNGNRTPFGLWLHGAWFLRSSDRSQVYQEFIQWMQTTAGNDVWFVSTSELIKWMQSPLSTEQMMSGFPCPARAPATETESVCDGLDDDDNGFVDERLVKNCYVQNHFFQTCFDCPVRYPRVTEPVPPVNPNPQENCNQPDGGCANGVWNNCQCICTGHWDSAKDGFCPDLEYRCTIPKLFNAKDKYYFCPVGEINSGPMQQDPNCPGKTVPKNGCYYGNWENCQCKCIGEGDSKTDGFCRDSNGACMVRKVFDEPSRTFSCPVEAATSDASISWLTNPFSAAFSVAASMFLA